MVKNKGTDEGVRNSRSDGAGVRACLSSTANLRLLSTRIDSVVQGLLDLHGYDSQLSGARAAKREGRGFLMERNLRAQADEMVPVATRVAADLRAIADHQDATGYTKLAHAELVSHLQSQPTGDVWAILDALLNDPNVKQHIPPRFHEVAIQRIEESKRRVQLEFVVSEGEISTTITADERTTVIGPRRQRGALGFDDVTSFLDAMTGTISRVPKNDFSGLAREVTRHARKLHDVGLEVYEGSAPAVLAVLKIIFLVAGIIVSAVGTVLSVVCATAPGQVCTAAAVVSAIGTSIGGTSGAIGKNGKFALAGFGSDALPAGFA